MNNEKLNRNEDPEIEKCENSPRQASWKDTLPERLPSYWVWQVGMPLYEEQG
jgi:hypothetical protein